jgi:sporulation protein YunB
MMFYRRRGKKPHHGFSAVMVSIAVLLLCILLVEIKISPLIQQLAKVRVAYLATKAINDAVDTEISSGKIKYEDLIAFEQNSEGQITALKTNMVKVNQLKVEITNIVLDRIDAIDQSQLYIPLGNIVNGDLFSGRGPRIPIKIVPTGVVTATFENQFSSAGINQTRHQVIMKLTVDMNVLAPGTTQATSVTSSVNVAETIIVGTVPGNYTYFDDSGDSTKKSTILDNK